MKRAAVSVLLAVGVFLPIAPAAGRAAEVDAQDILILRQNVENQAEAIDLLKRRVAALESRLAEAQRDTESLKRANGALTRDLVTQDQLKVLNNKVEQVDNSRASDSRRIFETLKKFADAPPVVIPPPAPTYPTERRSPRPSTESGESGTKTEPKTPKGEAKTPKPESKATKPPVDLPADSYEHVVKPNETVSEILIAYRKQYGLKTSMAQLEAANPGLNPKKLKVDQKINIPIVK